MSNLGIIRLSVSFLYKFTLEEPYADEHEQLAAFQNMVEHAEVEQRDRALILNKSAHMHMPISTLLQILTPTHSCQCH